jgi:peptide/nickel transport system substrate-binding protein
MKLLIVALIATICIPVFAEKATFVDTIQFVQYLDENTALEEVRNGNLDLYYYRMPSERLEDTKSRQGLQIFESTGGSYSILVNPAQADKFNPFSFVEVRFALNYLIDRNLVVNELMGGYGISMISHYGPFDPDYFYLLDELESFHFQYNPALAEKMISEKLEAQGAKKINGKWTYQDEELQIRIFIRGDDPVRKSIGEILSSELEKLGFLVVKDFGDLNKAFVVVYGSNPSELKWHIYTEGWGGRSAFVKYDPVGLAQMYSPWFSSMPGFNDPTYWNYKNDYLDSITQKIYTGNFNSAQERAELIKKATVEGIKESVRIFIAGRIDQYVASPKVTGIINDFGAGVPSRFTPINSRSDSDTLRIGVKQIYQGAWNPVMGLTDFYSRNIWTAVSDPGTFKHPYTGESFPIRTPWKVETGGPSGFVNLPDGVINWDPLTQEWKAVSTNKATSKITYDLLFANWHNGKRMDMNDILYSHYFVMEWGSQKQENDKTFDSEFTPQTSQLVDTIVGIRIVDDDTIEVYVNFWHFDEAEIADWGGAWSAIPWEIMLAMEKSVIDGTTSFSRSGAANKNIDWLSLIVPNNAILIKNYLDDFKKASLIPKPLEKFVSDKKYFESRYDASIKWIEKNNHAIISNGPFYLESYSPQSRTITIKSIDDPTYPFEAGHWKGFEEVKYPKIISVDVPKTVTLGEQITIPVSTSDSSQIYYFLTNPQGTTVSSGIKKVTDNTVTLDFLPEETSELGFGANDLKIFAISDAVLRPDIYATSFLAVSSLQQLPQYSFSEKDDKTSTKNDYVGISALVAGIIIVGFILAKRKQRKKAISSR